MLLTIPTVALAILGASTVLAQTAPTCSLTQKCPEDTPCCSRKIPYWLYMSLLQLI